MIESSLALYVHMPWCVRKCPYCDFNSHQLKSARPDAAYIDALLCDFDLELPRLAGRRIDTVFFGGGTPSLFLPEDFARLLCALKERIEFAPAAEITMEANPGTIERGRFAGYAEAGINRVSLGAQTFSQPALAALGRIHSADDTLRAVDELRTAGLNNFNIDLMYALPQQTLQEALLDVRTACALRPAHISYYQLTLEPGTVFHSRPPALPDEDSAWEIQAAGQALLAAAGYAQYEISAYAQPGMRCRHNLNYWLFGDYVGIGAGAHGKLSLARPSQILRTVKQKQPSAYVRDIESSKLEPAIFIPECDLPFEFMLNALRLSEGFRNRVYEDSTGLDMRSVEPRLLDAQRKALLQAESDGWRPTELGHRFLNDLQASFLA